MQPIEQRLAAGWTTGDANGMTTVTREEGIRAGVGFLETPGGRIFTVRHDPAASPHGALVICPPLLAEAIRNQRRELVLSWELSAVGWAVQRFHYRGAGHSSGDPAAMSFAGLVEDSLAAANDLRHRTGIENISFMGSRLGALAAAEAARECPGSPLILWEPPWDMDRYFEEIMRARMIGLLKSGRRGPSGKDLMDAFEADGVLDVVGNPVAYSLYESTRGLDPAELIIAAGPRPVLIVQMSVKPELRPGMVKLIERCREAGLNVDSVVVSHNEAWWFGASFVAEAAAGGLDAIPATVEFLGGMTS